MYDDITAVMIVKNEEECLERCLKSVTPLMPVKLADTGSTDRTMEIAWDHGVDVYEHPWADSFSESRNWINQYVDTKLALQIDADEVVPDVSIPELDKLDPESTAHMTPIHNVMPDGSMTLHQFERIYQPSKVHYKWRVHNELIVDEGQVAASGFNLLHYGYAASPEEMMKKYENTLRLLMMDIKDAGYVMRNVRYLIQTYHALQRPADILAVVDEHLDKLEGFPGIYQDAAATAIVAHGALGDNAKAKIAGLQLLKKFPEALDALFYLGVVYMDEQAWELSMDCFIRYLKVRTSLQLEGADSTVVYHTWGNRAEVFQNMGFCALMLDNTERAAMSFMRAEMLATHRVDFAGYKINTDNALCLLLGNAEPARQKIMNLAEPDSWEKPKKQLLTMEVD